MLGMTPLRGRSVLSCIADSARQMELSSNPEYCGLLKVFELARSSVAFDYDHISGQPNIDDACPKLDVPLDNCSEFCLAVRWINRPDSR
jgi:hypothetical protein